MRKPIIIIKDISSEKVSFTLKECAVEYANGLRRVMMAEVPTIAIDIVTVQENTSCVPDEAIVHRLGLLPVDSTFASEMKDRQDCSCEDSCQYCSARFDLDVGCDASANGNMTVTSEDVRPHMFGGSQKMVALVTPRDPITGEETPVSIVKLAPGQNIKMSMVAYRGVGKNHAKWNPTATAVFKYIPSITIDPKVQNLDVEKLRQVNAICHRKVFGLEGHSPAMFLQEDAREVLVLDRETECDFCGNCANLMQDFGIRGAINVSYVKGQFEFEVESSGVMSAEKIITEGMKILNQKMEMLQREAQKLPGNSRTRQDASNIQAIQMGGDVAQGGVMGGGALDLS